MIICSDRKNLNQLDNYQKYGDKLSWNVCTWHEMVDLTFLVRDPTCSSSHQMDTSLWQTFGKISFIHSSHKWLPTILSCGKHGSALSLGFIPRLRFCWRLSRTRKINFGEESCVSSEVEHLSPSVGCARSKRQYPTFLQNPKLNRAHLRLKCKTTRLWWTSSWRHINIHLGKDGRWSQITQNSQSQNVQMYVYIHFFFGHVFHDING